MAFDLTALLDVKHCALLILECQEGIIGAAGIGDLPAAVRQQGTVARIAALASQARAAHVPVFHLLASRRRDQGGSSSNCRLLALGTKSEPLVAGSPRHAPVAELTPEASDFVLSRLHGVTPFHGSELDSLLRNLGVQTVVACGVSVNVGITGMTIEAVNAGYQVVVPRDAVAGTPEEYVEAVFRNSLRLLATETSSEKVISAWQGGR